MPATGDRITKRKDGLFQGMYTAQTPDGPKRKYIYGRKYKDVEKKLAEAMGDAARGIYFDDENQTVSQYMERWLEDSARGDLGHRAYHNYKLQIRRHISPLSAGSSFRSSRRRTSSRSTPRSSGTASSPPASATSTRSYTVLLSRP